MASGTRENGLPIQAPLGIRGVAFDPTPKGLSVIPIAAHRKADIKPTLKIRAVLSGAYREASVQLRQLREGADSPWRRQVQPGRMRGIDHYSPIQLTWVLAHAMRRYKAKFGRYPNLVQPVMFNDKVMWLKFFGELKVPESGNKLATETFIPPGLRTRLRCPPLVWQNSVARLPANNEIAPGVYYLKASHGSGMFSRVKYPLDDAMRVALESQAAVWLTRRHGWDSGEWWYSVFTPQLLLDLSVTGDNDSISWNFYVLNGQVAMVGMFLKTSEGQEHSTWLDPEFRALPWQSTLPAVPAYVIGPQQQEMLAMAREIARPFSAVRIDFFHGEDNQIYLGELTFSPGNAMSRRPPEVDTLLSAAWTELR